ncbi:MAG: hypothetical protein SFX73_30240 [Kofleriaceae bacterium]|nr:hypothetical protein [Kofleriaceae bacterium]
MKHLLLGVMVAVGCGSSDDGAQLDAQSFDDAAAGDAGDLGDVDGAFLTCPAGTWCAETNPSGTAKLNGVFALTTDDVFAVGDAGTILRRQGGTWSAMTSTTTKNLRAVWAAGATDAWAVGASGTVLRWNGTAWAAAGPTTTTTLEAIWGSSATDVWAVGGTSAFRWNGTSWTLYGLSGSVMLDVHGTGPNDAWVASEGGYVKRWNGTSWSSVTSSGTGNFFAIRVLGTNNVWITTGVPGSRARSYNGSTWTNRDVSVVLHSLYSTGAELWGVTGPTSPGKIARWSGTAWTTETPSVVTQPLRAISGVGTSLWAVGDGGKIIHRE